MIALIILSVFILFVCFIIGLSNKDENYEYDKDDINYYIDNYDVYTSDHIENLEDE